MMTLSSGRTGLERRNQTGNILHVLKFDITIISSNEIDLRVVHRVEGKIIRLIELKVAERLVWRPEVLSSELVITTRLVANTQIIIENDFLGRKRHRSEIVDLVNLFQIVTTKKIVFKHFVIQRNLVLDGSRNERHLLLEETGQENQAINVELF